MGIAFTLHVVGSKDAVEPGSFRALDGMFFVIDEVVAQDFCLGGVSGGDLWAAVDEAMRLIKIDGLGDVVGNDGILLPEFGHAIHLDGE